MPSDNRFKVFIRWQIVTVSRMLGSFDDLLRDSRHGSEIHIRNPHRDHRKTILRLCRNNSPFYARADSVNRKCVFTSTIHNRFKIICHNRYLTFYYSSPRQERKNSFIIPHKFLFILFNNTTKPDLCKPHRTAFAAFILHIEYVSYSFGKPRHRRNLLVIVYEQELRITADKT